MTNMAITSSLNYLMAIVLTVFFNWFPASIFSDSVVGYDSVTTVETPVFLKVQTRGKVFPKGGERVTVQENGTCIKKLLTGGDGYGYFSYVSETKGFNILKYVFGQKTSECMVLVLEKDAPVIIIELESVLAKEPLSDETNKNAVDAITELSEKYHIVYICGAFKKIIGNRNWLKAKNMPQSVVLNFTGTSTFQSLVDQNVHIYAVIGSSSLLADASTFSTHRFSFEKTTHGKQIQNWEDILKALIQ